MPFFNDYAFAKNKAIAAIVQAEYFAPDSTLMREGDLGDRMFVVLKGKTEVSKVIGGES